MRALLYLPKDKPNITQVRNADLVLQLRPNGRFRVYKDRDMGGRSGLAAEVDGGEAKRLLEDDFAKGRKW